MISVILLSAGPVAAQIEFVGSCDLSGHPYFIHVEGSYAYVAGGQPDLQIIDISDPTNPYFTGSFDTTGGAWNIFVMDEYAFLANGHSGLFIIDVSDPSNPVFTGRYDGPGYAHDVVARKDLAYLVTCLHFSVIDISDPANPALIIEIFTDNDDARELFVRDSYAYISGYHGSGFRVVDVSYPSSPEVVGSYDAPDYAGDIFVTGEHAYIPSWEGLEILNVSNPENPYYAGKYDSTSICERIHCEGDYAFVVQNNTRLRGLLVLDISYPPSPYPVASYTPYGYNDVYVRNGYIYVISGSRLDILRFTLTAIDEKESLPVRHTLSQNHPNPFNAATTVSYTLPERGEVTISIYNILGQKAATIFDGMHEAGEHTITWDAADFPSGVYFARLEAGEHSENIKMVLLK